MNAAVYYLIPAAALLPVRGEDYLPARDDYALITVVTTHDLDTLWCRMNLVHGDELPFLLRCRSMSVGDVVLADGKAFLVAPCGWRELPDSVALAFV